MNKKKIKIVAYLLACSMLLSSCKIKLDGIFDKNDFDDYFPNKTTSSTIDTKEEVTEPEKETTDTKEEVTEPEKEATDTEEEVTEPEKGATDTKEEKGIYDVVYATTDVNLRSSNTTESLKIGKLKIGEAAYKIFSCDNNWDLVRYNETLAYVCRDYLEYSNEIESLGYEHTPYNDIVITTTDLNFRKDPSTEQARIDRFSANTELQVIAKVDNGWLLVKHNGQLGYVHADYTESLLEKAQREYPELNLSELDVKKLVFSTTDLNLRNGSGTEYDKIGELEEFESARVLAEYGDWYFVLTNEHNFGFINKSYTEDLEDIFVVVDKSEQILYLYNDDELYFSTQVTTGKDSTPSDTGYFSIYSKEEDRYLRGADYNVFVDYWMPYNGDEGLHDASWRSVFGTESYHNGGSHGCINIPVDIADDIYHNVSVGTKVLVHK